MTPNYDPFCSVLDNIETFRQILTEKVGYSKVNYSKFISIQHRKLNLTIANELLETSLANHDKLVPTIKGLLCCSSTSLLEQSENSAGIIRTSKKCNSKYCAICSRSKSIKLAKRLDEHLESVKPDIDIKNQRAYFLTLTLKHNGEIRKGIYIQELKEYLFKFLRSAVFKRNFTTDHQDIITGNYRNIETTITNNGYHIHSHILIFGPKLSKRVKEVENDLREKWLKITGDSTVIRLDLIKNKKKNRIDKTDNLNIIDLMPAIKEVVKYSTKLAAKKNQLPWIIEKFAQYIIDTRGLNFHNVTGDLRGNELTSLKSKYDPLYTPPEVSDSNNYFLARTSDIHFSGEKLFYSNNGKKLIKGKDMSISEIKGEIIKVGSSQWDTSQVMQISLEEKNAPDSIKWMAPLNGIKIQEESEDKSYNNLSYDERKKLAELIKQSTIEKEFINARPVEFIPEEIPF